MEILPVLDLLNGVVVRGIAGNRSEYRPIRSGLTDSHRPLDVARALRSRFDFQRLYVADLDGIVHHRPSWNLYGELIDDGFHLLIDAGIEDLSLAMRICAAGAQPIVGLESCYTPERLSEIAGAVGSQLTFSLDLLDGVPQLAEGAIGWKLDPIEIARQAFNCGVVQIIVLDLADVGTSSGGRTDSLCRRLRVEFPRPRLICGGGVRNVDDLLRIKALGVSDVLVASALHDGRLTGLDLERIRDSASRCSCL